MNRRQWLVRLAALAAFLLRPWTTHGRDRLGPQGKAAPTVVWTVRWMWSGAVGHDSATVVAKLTGVAAPVRLLLRPVRGGDDVTAAPVATAEPGVVRFTAQGLLPGTDYSYRVQHGDELWTVEGRLRTTIRGPQDAVILFGSCASTGSNAPIWDTMRAIEPHLLIHMGDLHYEDITGNDPDRYRAAFDRCLASPRQSAFYRDVPIAYVWDDHDFGGDDSNRHAPGAAAAHQVYRERVPHYPLAGGPMATIHQAFDIGRVRVIVTDGRSGREARDDNGGGPVSMLGAAQLQWLLDELEAASRTAALVVWANGVPWITRGDESTSHGWAPYAAERERIATHIEQLGLTGRLLMISGDAHMVAIDDGTNSQYAADAPAGRKGFVVVHAAAFDRFRRNKGGPYSLGSRAGRGQFGELRIIDDGERIEAVVTCRDSRGRQIDNLSIRMTSAVPAGAVSSPATRAADARAGVA